MSFVNCFFLSSGLNIMNIGGTYSIIGVGLVFSTICFFLEFWYWWCRPKYLARLNKKKGLKTTSKPPKDGRKDFPKQKKNKKSMPEDQEKDDTGFESNANVRFRPRI